MTHSFRPCLNSIPSNLNSHSWVDLSIYNNNFNHLISNDFSSTYIRTFKYKIYPTLPQKLILIKWLDSVIDVYNYTNDYLKKKIFHKNGSLKTNYKKYINFYNLRRIFTKFLNGIKNKSKINKHTLDYSIKLCVEMYKSAISNLKNKNIKQFVIRNLDYKRRRKNLVLEPNVFSKKINGFCVSQLGIMKSNVILKERISKNSILQYNSLKDEFYVISPKEETFNCNKYRANKCGCDIGIRTFITTYSENECYEIGKKINSDNR